MTSKARPSVPRTGYIFVLLCFFGSGATGLIYQVLWVRMIEQVVGAAPFAIALVLAVFMGGLGLGSYLASRWIDRAAEQPGRLLGWYGRLELGIGLSALLVPLVLAAMKPAYAWLYQSLSGHFLIFGLATGGFAALALLVPTTLMGATLPLLSRYVVSELENLSQRTGVLYGGNTLGAALGALLAGVVLLPALGLQQTLLLAVVVNGAIGGACILVGGRAKWLTAGPDGGRAKQSRPILPDRAPARANASLALFLALMAISGFCSLAYEVLLTKLLSLIVGPTTYSFTVVLVTFIGGLALGSVIFGWLGDRVRRPDLLLLWTQLGAAVTMLLSSQLLGDSQFFFGKLLFTFQSSFGQQQVMKALALFCFMLPSTLCLGGTFPLAAKLITGSADAVGRSLGVGYAINTAGCVAGSVIAGFLLVPLVGKEAGFSLVIGLQLLAVMYAVLRLTEKAGRERLALLGAGVVGLAGCLLMPRWNHLHLSSSKYHRFQPLLASFIRHGWGDALLHGSRVLGSIDQGQLLYYGEGVGGFTTVIETADLLGNPELAMANSGKFDASSVGDMKTQVLLAHVPMQAHPHPEQVMVLGLGSGITTGEALLYPSVRQIDVVEIGSQVVPASRLFNEFSNRVLDQPKVNLIIQDARAHLALGGRRYDVVISEPSNPWMAGMSSLFTREFFELVKSRLRPGGIYVQFIHSYEIGWSSFALVLRTFASVYPNAVLLSTHPSQEGADYLLVGFADSNARLHFDDGQREPLERSSNVRLADPALLYRLIVSEDLAVMGGSGPINTEDRPILEFEAPRSLYVEDPSIAGRIRALSRLSPETTARVRELKSNPDQAIAYADFAFSVRTPFSGMEPAGANRGQQDRFTDLVNRYSSRYQTRCSLFHDHGADCLRSQIAALESREAVLDANGLAYLGDLYLTSGRRVESRAALRQALEKDSTTLLALNDSGILSGQEGKPLDAIEYFERAQRINPLMSEPYLNLGIAYLQVGRKEWATRNFSAALRIDPTSAAARRGLQESMNR